MKAMSAHREMHASHGTWSHNKKPARNKQHYGLGKRVVVVITDTEKEALQPTSSDTVPNENGGWQRHECYRQMHGEQDNATER